MINFYEGKIFFSEIRNNAIIKKRNYKIQIMYLNFTSDIINTIFVNYAQKAERLE